VADAVLKANQIKPIHGKLCQQLRGYFESDVLIHPRIEGWENAFGLKFVEFDMKAQGPLAFVRAQRSQRNITCPVILLRPFENDPEVPGAWCAWYEKWNVEGNRRFTFETASITFFWGTVGFNYSDNTLRQAFRAEWDLGKSGVNGAQPHWQIDWLIYPDEYVAPRLQQDLTVLEELQPGTQGMLQPYTLTTLKGLSISRIHLGMRGWQGDEEEPKCWQFRPENLAEDLMVWAQRTLAYVEHQFQSYRYQITEQ
jgi:hypothetical protein